MDKFWQPGEAVVLRGVIKGRTWAAQAVTVVDDRPEQTALLLVPGAECAFPEGYWRWRSGDASQGSRWDDSGSGAWRLRRTTWNTNRFLILVEPERWYATYYIWEHATNVFGCYYVNFQLPARRTPVGFDTLDLDLDMVVAPDYTWHWKDEDEYAVGLSSGGIVPEWAEAIEREKPEVLATVAARRAPFDGAWLNWRPPAEWTPPGLIEGWEMEGLPG